MTEEEWLSATDPKPMLEFLMLEFLRGKASERKLRLLSVACCRGIWHLLTDERSRKAVEVAEHYADGSAPREELVLARTAAKQAEEIEALAVEQAAQWSESAAWGEYNHSWDAAQSAVQATSEGRDEVESAVSSSAGAAFLASDPTPLQAAKQQQVTFVRDIFGNPFRPVTLNPTWLTPSVVSLAQAAYDHRLMPSGTLEPDRLAVLADALEEAGCDNAEMLSHLRSNGPHVRGCWAVDLALGKE